MSKVSKATVARGRCRSQQHLSGSPLGGCGDPRCPEGLYRDRLIAEAIASNDFNALFDEMVRQHVAVEAVRTAEPQSFLDAANGWVQVDFAAEQEELYGAVRLNPQRAYAAQIVADAHANPMPAFQTHQELVAHVQQAYQGEVHYRIDETTAGNLTQWEVVDVSVPPDMRGHGIAARLRRACFDLADRNRVLVSGTPTTGGDGRYDEYSPLFKAAATEHHGKLRAAYYRSGYVDNPFFKYRDEDEEESDTNPLTGEVLPDASVAQAVFTDAGADLIRFAGQYLRFPKGKVLPGMLVRGATFDTKTYRR